MWYLNVKNVRTQVWSKLIITSKFHSLNTAKSEICQHGCCIISWQAVLGLQKYCSFSNLDFMLYNHLQCALAINGGMTRKFGGIHFSTDTSKYATFVFQWSSHGCWYQVSCQKPGPICPGFWLKIVIEQYNVSENFKFYETPAKLVLAFLETWFSSFLTSLQM